MTAKFTSGPWRAVLNTPPAAIPGHLIKTDDSVERPIAALWEGGGTRGKPEQIANAQLISAAPELYEALELANEHFQHSPHTRTGEGGVTEHEPRNCTRCIIDAALKKARGEK